jgi:hypothetical protein
MKKSLPWRRRNDMGAEACIHALGKREVSGVRRRNAGVGRKRRKRNEKGERKE